MRAGRLDRRVTIEQNSPTRSGTGAQEESWSTLATVWAEARAVSGGEIFRGQHMSAEVTMAFVVRHRTDITPQMRIVHDGDTYRIERITELGRQEGLILQARAVDL